MIAIDTNILVYARREETPFHKEAKELLRNLAEGDSPCALPWPCIYEFLRVITHPRVFDPPTQLEVALEDLESLTEAPSLVLLGEGHGHFNHLCHMVRSGQTIGNLAHDAHIAALIREHGVDELGPPKRTLHGSGVFIFEIHSSDSALLPSRVLS
jgi:toxin-antitoxin system PIN domain toxin